MLNIKALLLVILSLVATTDVLAERKWPDKTFNCQVITVSGATGLVSVQTFSLKDAEADLVGLTAITLLGNRESAANAVQCVESGSENTFRDQNFQAWFDGLAK